MRLLWKWFAPLMLGIVGGQWSNSGIQVTQPTSPSSPDGTTSTTTTVPQNTAPTGGSTTTSSSLSSPTDPTVQQPTAVSRVGAGGFAEMNVVLSAALVAAGAEIQAPGRMLLPDEFVEVVALPTNQANVFVGNRGPGSAKFGPAIVLTAANQTPRQLNARVLSELWIYGTVAGDGVGITVRSRGRF
jgi:hypothetical protein